MCSEYSSVVVGAQESSEPDRIQPRNGMKSALLFGGTNPQRIRTAEIGSRDRRAEPRSLSPKLTVSGSESKHPDSQNPTESREFLGSNLDRWEESLPTQTQWRWGESGANSSLGAIPCSAGKIQGNPPDFGPDRRARAKIPEPFRAVIDGFPTTTSREYIRTNREFVSPNRETGLRILNSGPWPPTSHPASH